MRATPLRLTLAFVTVLVLSARAADDAGFRPLVRGADPAQFELVGIGPTTLQINDGVVSVSGKPNGYFVTKDAYKNYVLRFDWMYERPQSLASDAEFNGNSGLISKCL